MKVSKSYIKLLIFTLSLSFIVPNVLISKKSNSGQFPKIIMPYIDNDQKLTEDENSLLQTGVPLRFAEKTDVNYNTINSGEWFNYNEKYNVWKLHIISHDAIGLKLFFDQFKLNENEVVYIYNESQDMIIGPITYSDNQEGNTFSHKLLKGSSIYVEYFIPTTYTGIHHFQISRVYHAYRDIHGFYEIRDRNCGENVACDSANLYEDQVNSVIYLEMYQYLCSAALVNNTAQDLTPYVLTAQHCLDSETEVGVHNSFTFYFNHQGTSCSSSSGNYSYSETGSYLRAEDTYTDFALLEMDDDPSSWWNPYFAGWSRYSSSPTISCGIHHPAGNPKKINYDDDQAGNNSWSWAIAWNEGGTEGGSSGSPAFDNNGRIIGQLYGGNIECGGTDYYGKFSSSWSGSSSSSRLSDWLDPGDTSTYTLDGTYDGCSSTYDCEGVCGGSAVEDECGECNGQGIPEYFCDCDENVEDCAGSCGGSATEDCAGICEGSSIIDECGVCGGDGYSCHADIYFGDMLLTTDLNQIEVYINHQIPIAGFQFNVTSDPDCIVLENAGGGIAENLGFQISSTSNGIVLGFSLSGETIDPGENLLTNLFFSSGCDCNLCLDNIVLTDPQGIELIINDEPCSYIINSMVGDINQDLVINVSDIVLLVAIILEDYIPTNIESNLSDVNNDDYINVADIVFLVDIIIN